MPKQFTKVARTNDLKPGDMKLVEIGDERILLANIGGELYAVSDECPHAMASLSEGFLEETVVECALHGSRFDVTTGMVTQGPAEENLKVYPVRVQDADILIGPPEG